MRRHLLAGAAIDDDRLVGAEAARGAGGVEGGVAAAIDDNLAPEQRRRLALHRAQQRDGVEDLRRAAGRNIGALGDMGADGEKRRVEAARGHRRLDVVDARVELQRDAEIENAADLRVEDVARQPVFGDAEAHHAARQRTRLADHDLMAEPRELIGGGEPGRPGADDKRALARFHGGLVEGPALFDGEIAEEALDRIDADGDIENRPIASGFAGVIADASHAGGQRIVSRQRAPGRFVVAGFGVAQPALDVLARRAGVVAGRQTVDIDRPFRAPASGVVELARADVERDGEGVFHRVRPGWIRRRSAEWLASGVMAGLAPAIHVSGRAMRTHKDVGGRDKHGHDGSGG